MTMMFQVSPLQCPFSLHPQLFSDTCQADDGRVVNKFLIPRDCSSMVELCIVQRLLFYC